MSTEDSSESTGTLERVPSECVSCAIEKGLASETKSEADISIDTGVSAIINLSPIQKMVVGYRYFGEIP